MTGFKKSARLWAVWLTLLVFTLATNIFFVTDAARANAQEQLPHGTFITMKKDSTAAVNAVIDPYTLQLTDGRLVRLTGIFIPDFDMNAPGDFSLLAMDVLRDMLNGQAVNVFQTTKKEHGQTNRMGQALAHLERVSDGAWVQGSLIRLGLAQVQTSQRNPEMALQMYELERQAREERLGVWADERFHVLSTEEAESHLDQFQIVEGVILATATRKNRIYLNFGKNWRTDFTVSIDSPARRLFSKAGLDPMNWNNQPVRVRGWLREYNGAYMELDHPQAIEILPMNDKPSMVDSIR